MYLMMMKVIEPVTSLMTCNYNGEKLLELQDAFVDMWEWWWHLIRSEHHGHWRHLSKHKSIIQSNLAYNVLIIPNQYVDNGARNWITYVPDCLVVAPIDLYLPNFQPQLTCYVQTQYNCYSTWTYIQVVAYLSNQLQWTTQWTTMTYITPQWLQSLA